MNISHKNLIKERFENAVHEYCHAFCQKHEFDYDPDAWVGEDVGGVLEINEGLMYVDFDDIRLDINKDAPKGAFEVYYEYSVECEFVDGAKQMNYRSWLNGYRPYTAEQLRKMHEAQTKVMKSKQELEMLMNEYNNKTERL